MFYKSFEFRGYSFKYPRLSLSVDSLDHYGLEYVSTYRSDMFFYSDGKDLTALVLRESVPTFDSGDRQWDSYKKLYLIPKNGHVIGFLERGGYKVASVSYLSEIVWGDERTKTFMEKTGLFG